jgi:ABC-2 type transport system permease protein
VTRLAALLLLRVRYQFLDWSGAWWFALTLACGNVAGPLTGLAVWSGNAAYFVALMAVQLLTASYENHTFGNSVYDGKVSHDLLKPQPVVVGPLGENLAIRCWLAVFGLPLAASAAVATGSAYRWSSVLLAMPALLGAAVLRFLWTWLLALAAFWTERVHALATFGNVLVFVLGGAAAPLSELPGPWRSVCRLLPFHPMLGLPADIGTGTVRGPAVGAALLTQLAWILVAAAAAVVVWRAGVRRYTAVGG